MKNPFVQTLGSGSVVLATLFLAAAVQAQTYSVLYTFSGGTDGSFPTGTLIRDGNGNLYGVTSSGGDMKCGSGFGCGTAFRLSPSGTKFVLHRFHHQPDANSASSLIRDREGNLYGTGQSGGSYGYGSIFKIAPGNYESVFFSFPGKQDGQDPHSNLIRDEDGNFYGTTLGGGDYGFCPTNGCGTVYKVDKYGQQTVLHRFSGPPDGYYPLGGLVTDEEGNLFGTTNGGGTGNCTGSGGCGVVFKIDRHGVETIVYDFLGGANDGAGPDASLIKDEAGNLYGTTVAGGPSNQGTVFKLDKDGAVTLLHSFTGGTDGGAPVSHLLRDPAGNLYGTTYDGGLSSCGFMGSGCGVVFKLDRNASFSVLHAFTLGTDGGFPYFGGLIRDRDGNLYGVTSSGGSTDNGVVFKIAP